MYESGDMESLSSSLGWVSWEGGIKGKEKKLGQYSQRILSYH